MHHGRRTLTNRTGSFISGKLQRRHGRRSGARKIHIDGVLMRNPSLEPSREFPQEPDNDQSLINRHDDTCDEWTDEDSVSDNNYFHWEEEETLFSDLLEESSSEPSETQLVALVESLQKPFDDESRKLKKEIAATFVPVVNKIKDVFSSIESTVETGAAAGLLMLNSACRELESSLGSLHHLTEKIQNEYQAQTLELLGKLEDEYNARERLWIDFEQNMNELVGPALEMLKDAPARMERTITSIEKQSRILEKEGLNAITSATELTLKDFLSRLE